ncbi:LysE family translocator [Vibrio methylphosphonaticus]|uniref:LysE family translocator n=1 Tax=Vibrio methylphosphonaticus TaxID=2946866 RepID=UPI00202A4915|nr:LysE family translocator [Vibrio methylphosphonaticus]MCL9775266.1 LysE family translocator [Vibrio methylphosphonaticus]
MADLLSFSLIIILLVMSPGPNGVLILRSTSLFGKTAALCNIVGFILAMFVQASLGIFGISAILLGSPYFFNTLKYIGSGYFLYVGIKMLVGSFGTKASTSVPGLKHYTAPKAYKSVLEGFLTQFSNPKGILFYLAAFPQFVDFDNFRYFDAYLLVAIHGVVLLTWFYTVALIILKMKGNVQNSAAGTWVNRIAGMVMIYFGCVLFLQ